MHKRTFIILAAGGILLTAIVWFVWPRQSIHTTPHPLIEFHIDWSPGPDYIGYYIADELGYYGDENLNVRIVPGNGAELAAQLLSANTIHVGTSTVDALVRKGIRELSNEGVLHAPRIAAIIFEQNPVVIVSPEAQPINAIDDLKGRRVGYSEETSVTYAQLQYLLSQHEDIRESVTLVRVGWSGPQELQRGAVDAVLAYLTDVPPDLKSRNYDFAITRLSDFGLTLPGQCIAIAPDSTISSDTFDALIRASIRGWEYARDHPVRAAEIFASRYPDQDAGKIRDATIYTIQLLPDLPDQEVALNAYTAPGRLRAGIRATIDVATEMTGISLSAEQQDRLIDALSP